MCVFFILFHLYTVQKLSILSVIRVKVMLQCRSRIHGPLYLHIYHNFLYSLEIKSQWPQERLGIPSKLVVQAITQNFMKPQTSFMLQHISPGSKLIFIPEFPNIQIRLGERCQPSSKEPNYKIQDLCLYQAPHECTLKFILFCYLYTG